MRRAEGGGPRRRRAAAAAPVMAHAHGSWVKSQKSKNVAVPGYKNRPAGLTQQNHRTQNRLFSLGLDTSFDGASINFLESVSMVPLSTFGKTFAKFAQISLKKKGRGVSEGPRREKNSEKSQNTTPF